LYLLLNNYHTLTAALTLKKQIKAIFEKKEPI
jgi:hypothetical protein